MRPLPRLFAFTDRTVRLAAELDRIAGAIASAGPAVVLVARDPEASAAELTGFAVRLAEAARPAEAAVIVSGRPDIAAGLGLQGVQLRAADLSPADARRILPHGWIGRSVHSLAEGETALSAGADYLVAGPVWPTPSHPGREPAGLRLIQALARLGRPVIAIGGVTPARAGEARTAGAYGVAAISALWFAVDPAAAATAMLDVFAS